MKGKTRKLLEENIQDHLLYFRAQKIFLNGAKKQWPERETTNTLDDIKNYFRSSEDKIKRWEGESHGGKRYIYHV